MSNAPDSLEAGLQRYYAARAPEYDRVYLKPERQADLRRLEAWLPALFAGRRVLEVACGTGYWTQFIAPAAASVRALDSSAETMAIAAQRVPAGRVEFAVGDAYALPHEPGRFDAAFAGFWFSHVLKHRQREFLAGLGAALAPGATVVLLDNRFVAGSNHAISETDDEGNTWQARPLDDGSTHRVLKNFPSEAELRALLAGLAQQVEYTAFDYYWALRYTTPTV